MADPLAVLFDRIEGPDDQARAWKLWDRWMLVALDPMFVTARHTIQASPRFAKAGPEHRARCARFTTGPRTPSSHNASVPARRAPVDLDDRSLGPGRK